jgi:hypothetical protein
LKYAAPAEVVFTDTFQSGDSRYKYEQAYFDLASHWGDVFPMRSRRGVCDSFADFCCQNWVSLILVRENIGENIGGDLIEECRKRNVKSAYICPHHPQQNYAEGYLGRVTAMASFGMVYAGAPLYMWIWAVKAAVFIYNITASYFSRQKVWDTPYEVIHGEPFPDTSIVVPFGCAALILLDADDRAKFKSRCSLLIFLHYAPDHPFFTYAFFSPRTKRVLFRQDCIFLTSVFPMREARVHSGMAPAGDTLVTQRSSQSVRDGCPSDLSFDGWEPLDPLPDYNDDVTGFGLGSPSGNLVEEPDERLDLPVHFPDHPAFGPVSSVSVPIPASPHVPPAGELVSTTSQSNDRIGIEDEIIFPPPGKQEDSDIMERSGSEANLSGARVAETDILQKFGGEIHQSGARVGANESNFISPKEKFVQSSVSFPQIVEDLSVLTDSMDQSECLSPDFDHNGFQSAESVL